MGQKCPLLTLTNMKWYSVTEKLPKPEEEVLVWMKYEDSSEFEWDESWIYQNQNDDGYYFGYREPLSNKYWAMGSARGYIITHWAYVVGPRSS